MCVAPGQLRKGRGFSFYKNNSCGGCQRGSDVARTSFLPHRTLAFKEGAPRVLSRAQRAAYWSPVLSHLLALVLATYLHPEGLPRGDTNPQCGQSQDLRLWPLKSSSGLRFGLSPTQCGPPIGLARQTMGWTFLGVRETSALE